MGHEGLGRRATGNRVQHRRLDFEKARIEHGLADAADGLAARLEGAAGGVGHDEVDVALAVAQLLVGHAMELVGQRTQRLRQQARRVGVHRQLALVGLEDRPLDGDDVADVPLLESGVGLFAERAALEVDLDAAAAVLQRGEAGLAHDALEHHAAGHLDRDRRGRQRLLVQAVVPGVQVGGVRIGHEIVGERNAGFTQSGQLGAPFGDQAVFILGGRGGRLVGHGGLLVVADVVDFGGSEIVAIQVGENAGSHVGGRGQLAGGVEFPEAFQGGKSAGSLARMAPCMSVSTMPGASATTRTPSWPCSCLSTRLYMSSAALAAQ